MWRPTPPNKTPAGSFDISSFKRVGMVNGKSVYYTTPINDYGYGTFPWAADQLQTTPLIVPKRITLDRIGLRVAAPASATQSRLGIYADNGNVFPSRLVLDAGTVDVTTAGFKFIEINQTLEPGLYWLATLHNGDVTLNVSTPANHVNVMGHDPEDTAQAYSRVDAVYPFTAGSLPNPFPADGRYILGGYRLVFVRLSA